MTNNIQSNYKIKTFATKDMGNIPPNAIIFRLNQRKFKNTQTFYMWFCFIKGKVYGDFVENNNMRTKREEMAVLDVMVRQLQDTMCAVWKIEQSIESKWLHKRLINWFKTLYYKLVDKIVVVKWKFEDTFKKNK